MRAIKAIIQSELLMRYFPSSRYLLIEALPGHEGALREADIPQGSAPPPYLCGGPDAIEFSQPHLKFSLPALAIAMVGWAGVYEKTGP